jgi:hypothetical protein
MFLMDSEAFASALRMAASLPSADDPTISTSA